MQLVRTRDLVPGRRFGLWEVKSPSILRSKRRYVQCLCVCGTNKEVLAQSILSGRSSSCGCIRQTEEYRSKLEKQDKVTGTPLHNIWRGMRQRCSNLKVKNYAGRGIKMCTEWRDSFRAFESWALCNGYNRHLSIDRIDVNGNYEPSNCRWADSRTQARNRRDNLLLTAFWETKTAAEWATDPRCAVKEKTLYFRVSSGFPHEKAITWKPAQEIITAFGENKTLSEWAQDHRCVVPKKILWQRINTNRMHPEQAIAMIPHHKKTHSSHCVIPSSWLQ